MKYVKIKAASFLIGFLLAGIVAASAQAQVTNTRFNAKVWMIDKAIDHVSATSCTLVSTTDPSITAATPNADTYKVIYALRPMNQAPTYTTAAQYGKVTLLLEDAQIVSATNAVCLGKTGLMVTCTNKLYGTRQFPELYPDLDTSCP